MNSVLLSNEIIVFLFTQDNSFIATYYLFFLFTFNYKKLGLFKNYTRAV